MRDTFCKNFEYFNNLIKLRYDLLKKGESRLESGSIKPDRIDIVKSSFSYKYLTIIRAKYSRGDDMLSNELKRDYEKAVNLIYEASITQKINLLNYIENGKSIYLNQYILQFHFDMMDMLSIGILINVPIEMFGFLVKKIDIDNVKDHVFEFLIRSKIEDRLSLIEENFKEFSWYKDRFNKIKEIIKTENKTTAQEKLKNFLEKDWYNILHDTAGYNQHNKDNGNYAGYWCFVAAAIVKIKELDDSSFRDSPYYPKDMII